MTLTVTLHLVAGLGALGMGGGMLLHQPARARNRAFALLCGALALWNLGIAGAELGGARSWRWFYLLGSCSTAPLALYFALVLTGAPAGVRRRYLLPAGLLAGALWLARWFPLRLEWRSWAMLAIVIIGGVLVLALRIIGRHARTLPPGAERRALHGVFWGGLIAGGGGLSDFIPRGDVDFLRLGPLAVLLFLLIVCAVIVRQNLLDLDLFLLRTVALVAGAGSTGLIFYGVTRLSQRFSALFLTSILVLAVAGPLGRLILTRARTALAPADPMVTALMQISRRLPLAGDGPAIRRIIEEGRGGLPGDFRFDIYLRPEGRQDFVPLLRSGGDAPPDLTPVGLDYPIALLLERERLPLTRRYVEQEAAEGRALARLALERLVAAELRLVVPLLRGARLVGWIGAGGGLFERYITSEVATALHAVGNQAIACLDRIEALDRARRKESLAAVGELAAGLAHEVRNPAAAIRGAAQAMGPEATESQKREMLEVIEEETERLGRVVGEFLQYARPGEPARGPVDLVGLARRALQGAELAGKTLRVELSGDANPPRASGDADQLLRVFENLIRNAWEAAGEGGTLRVEVRAEDDEHVSILFEDNGPGIPAEEMPRLFRPFHTTKPGGTGLGLALIHRIVEGHGGELRVEGRPGIGAAFTLVLPVARAGEEP